MTRFDIATVALAAVGMAGIALAREALQSAAAGVVVHAPGVNDRTAMAASGLARFSAGKSDKPPSSFLSLNKTSVSEQPALAMPWQEGAGHAEALITSL